MKDEEIAREMYIQVSDRVTFLSKQLNELQDRVSKLEQRPVYVPYYPTYQPPFGWPYGPTCGGTQQ